MRFKFLGLALITMSLSACAQMGYSSYNDDYQNVTNRNCVTQFDEVIDETSTVKNVLVRNKEVINYYHDNVVVENHFNINGRVVGYARHASPRPIYHSNRRNVVIPRAEMHNSYSKQSQYSCLEDETDNKWFFFFQLNSDCLTNKEELGHLIEYAVINKYSPIYIDAYADAETGTYENNILISKLRANTIINVLIKEGVTRNRIFVKYHGSTSQPYKTNNFNRCVIVSTGLK